MSPEDNRYIVGGVVLGLRPQARKIAGMAKRGYSREFKTHGDTGKRYLLDEIPAGLWADVKVKAKRQGVSIRALILKLLSEWVGRSVR